MRIIVISDSHGSIRNIDYAISSFPDANDVFFLGDCVRDIEKVYEFYPKITFHTVSGNCDFNPTEPAADETVIAGKRILFTHGHTLYVKHGIEKLIERAENIKADIVLYGHTHIPKIDYINGIYFINPGSVGASRSSHNSFCVIDIKPNGILPSIVEI